MKPCIWSSPYLVMVKYNIATKRGPRRWTSCNLLSSLLGLELQISWFPYLDCLSKGIKWNNFQKLQFITLWWSVESNMAACMTYPFVVAVYSLIITIWQQIIGRFEVSIINYVVCNKITKNNLIFGKTNYTYYWKPLGMGNTVGKGPFITAKWMSWWI